MGGLLRGLRVVSPRHRMEHPLPGLFSPQPRFPNAPPLPCPHRYCLPLVTTFVGVITAMAVMVDEDKKEVTVIHPVLLALSVTSVLALFTVVSLTVHVARAAVAQRDELIHDLGGCGVLLMPCSTTASVSVEQPPCSRPRTAKRTVSERPGLSTPAHLRSRPSSTPPQCRPRSPMR